MKKLTLGFTAIAVVMVGWLFADPTLPSTVQKYFRSIDMQGLDIFRVGNVYLDDGDTNTLKLSVPSLSADGNFTFPADTPDANDVLVSTDTTGETNWQKIGDAEIADSADVSRNKLASGTAGYVVFNNDSNGTLAEEQYLDPNRGGLGRLFNDANLENGETLIYNSSLNRFFPGASGDDSFNCLAADANTLTIKGGAMWYNGKELVTASSDDTTDADEHFIDIDTIEFTGKASSTAYYIYIDTLDAKRHVLSVGGPSNIDRLVYSVDPNDFYIDTNTPESGLIDLNRYAPICFAITSGIGTFTPSTTETLAKRNLVNWVNFKQYNSEEWQAASPILSISTNVTSTGLYRRDGEEMEMQGQIVFGGTNTEGPININVPSGFTEDESKMTSSRMAVGFWASRDVSTGLQYGGTVYYLISSSTMFLSLSDGSADAVDTSTNDPFTVASGDIIAYRIKIPIVGWTNNSDAIATPLNSPRKVITSINNTPTSGKHTITWDVPFSNNEYAIMINHTFAGVTKQVVLDNQKTASTLVIDANSLTVDDTNYLVVKASPSAMNAVLPVGGIKYTGTNTTAANNVSTQVDFDSEEYNRGGIVYDADANTFTVLQDGYYDIDIQLAGAGAGAFDALERFQVQTRKNSTVVHTTRATGNGTASQRLVSGHSFTLFLQSGDVIDVLVFQNSGSTLPLINDYTSYININLRL